MCNFKWWLHQNSALQSCASQHSFISHEHSGTGYTPLLQSCLVLQYLWRSLLINEKVHLIKALMCALYYLKLPHKTFSINFLKCRTGHMYFTQAMVQHFSPPLNTMFPLEWEHLSRSLLLVQFELEPSPYCHVWFVLSSKQKSIILRT